MNFCFIWYCQESAQGSEDLDQIDTTEFKSFLDSPEVPSSDESQVDLAGDDIKSKMLNILLDKDIQTSKQNTVNIEGRNFFEYQILLCFYRSCFKSFFKIQTHFAQTLNILFNHV